MVYIEKEERGCRVKGWTMGKRKPYDIFAFFLGVGVLVVGFFLSQFIKWVGRQVGRLLDLLFSFFSPSLFPVITNTAQIQRRYGI